MNKKMTAADGGSMVEHKADLIAIFEGGEKPPSRWRIGTEHEKLVFRLKDHRQPGWAEAGGIRDLLQAFGRFGWEPIIEDGHVIGATGQDGSLSLEPAGQFELSGAPLDDLHGTYDELRRHQQQCAEIGAELGLGFLALGANPQARRADLSWMPKGRYGIMQRYMPQVGNLGLDMMLRTCTVQVNLDYESEADMVQKFRVSLALQPVVTALFANSPFTEGQPNGFLSWRSHVWTDTDADRTGMLPFVFDEGFGYERYCDYMLDVPMYFIQRGGQYLDLAGQSFRAFMDGALPTLPGERPTITDWEDHLSTTFPEVRLKSFLEMRGADVGPLAQSCALSALWVGLLYDRSALDAAWDLVRGWSVDAQQQMRDDVPRLALRAHAPDGRPLREVALDVLALSRGGLERRARLNAKGQDESRYLDPLDAIADSGQTQAERWLTLYQGDWQQNIAPIWDAARF